MASTVVKAALVLATAAAQDPMMGGQWLDSPDLPGMPIEVSDSRNWDAGYCAVKCYARSDCFGFNYAPASCKSKPKCPYSGGCCWLKSAASSANITTVSCGGSFIMRPPAGSYGEFEAPPAPNTNASAKNVLYFIIDDMRPDVAPYGQSFMVTPGIQALANNGTTFDRTYCTIAVCSPSRNSFLTGRMPSTTGVWNFVNHFRQANCAEHSGMIYKEKFTPYVQMPIYDGGAGQCCSSCTADAQCTGWTLHTVKGLCYLYNDVTPADMVPGVGIAISGVRGATTSRSWVSLPGHFKVNGYLVQGSGKIYHAEDGGMGPAPWDGPGTGMPPLADPPSWSPGNSSMANVNALAVSRGCSTGQSGNDSCSVPGADFEGNVPEGTFNFVDRITADDAIDKLRRAIGNFRTSGQRFFSAVGFRKPHIPFRHPGVYDSLYPDPADIPVAKYKVLDASQPPIAFYQTGAAQNPYVPQPDLYAARLRRDYYAAISWMDHQVTRVVNEIYNAGLVNDTLIVFHSDHGYSLGEHGQWEKFTNFEHGTRVPLIISSPWIPGSAGTRTMALASLVDMFPTLTSLAGVPAPKSYGLEGQDLSPVIQYEAQKNLQRKSLGAGAYEEEAASAAAPPSMRNYTLSVYPRCPANLKNASLYWQNNDCLNTERTQFPFMGISLRTDRFRYTEWRRWNGTQLAPISGGSGSSAPRLGAPTSADLDAAPEGPLVAVELYDHQGDNGTSFDGAYEVQNLAGNPSYASYQAQLAAMLHSVYPSWA